MATSWGPKVSQPVRQLDLASDWIISIHRRGFKMTMLLLLPRACR